MLVADAVGQALVVLVVGVTAGAGLTALGGLGLPDSMPAVVDASTIVPPGLLLAACGLAGVAVTALIGSVARDSGAAALYVTHDRAQLAGADRVVEIVDGRLDVPVPA
ncbi:hypothetical protein [Corynebacterium sp.]|uniref:hypothetical protein n=1 Tax=Corynebacterium sp. TaxID=1720 RepID=UPI0026DC38E9|nr:hypothetical protein [Corynebacterium sp.]MDO4610934.1 hypothetical protein [Corynebacterium sp.]